MTTQRPLAWTILPSPSALARIRSTGAELHTADDWQPGQMALLHPADDPSRILAARSVDTPDLHEALLSDSGPGSAQALASAIAEAAGDWWRSAHVWTAYCRWRPEHGDWRVHLAPCPASDADGLAAILAPTRGWLLWDFQWMSVLLACGAAWDEADALRRAWNLNRPGTLAALADLRANGHRLDDVLRARTLAPLHVTSRVDAWSVQRLVGAMTSPVEVVRDAGHDAHRPIGFSLTEAEARQVSDWAADLVAAMQDQAIEFPGVEFILGVSPHGETLDARIGNRILSLR